MSHSSRQLFSKDKMSPCGLVGDGSGRGRNKLSPPPSSRQVRWAWPALFHVKSRCQVIFKVPCRFSGQALWIRRTGRDECDVTTENFRQHGLRVSTERSHFAATPRSLQQQVEKPRKRKGEDCRADASTALYIDPTRSKSCLYSYANLCKVNKIWRILPMPLIYSSDQESSIASSRSESMLCSSRLELAT